MNLWYSDISIYNKIDIFFYFSLFFNFELLCAHGKKISELIAIVYFNM